MRRSLAASVILAGLTTPAQAQTENLEYRGLSWGDCLRVFRDYDATYKNKGGKLLGRINKQRHQSVAYEIDKELIVVECKRRRGGIFFVLTAAPL